MSDYSKSPLEIDMSGLDEESKKRIRAAVTTSGLDVAERDYGKAIARPASVGEIETSLQIETNGLEDNQIYALRDKVFAAEKHNKILESIMKGALGDYGGSVAHDPFVQWVWCQWLQYAGSLVSNPADKLGQGPHEIFKKRYAIKPGVAATAIAG